MATDDGSGIDVGANKALERPVLLAALEDARRGHANESQQIILADILDLFIASYGLDAAILKERSNR